MSSDNYYLLTFLPSLDSLDADPTVSPADFLEKLEVSLPIEKVAKALFLSDDLMLRDSFMAGEINDVEPLVLSVEACKDEQPLPDELAGDPNATTIVTGDLVWEAYFYFADKVAAQAGSEFLKNWIGFEIFLRNTLVEVRAEALGLEPADYFIARDLEESHVDPAAAIAEWTTAVADNPLKAQIVLDSFRWEWLEQNGKYFSFSDDELAAYAVKLMLAWRWKRINDAIEKDS